MKHKIFVCLLCLSAALLLLCGCGTERYEYTTVTLRESEPLAPDFMIAGEFEQTKIDGNLYQFSDEISPNDRSRFVEEQAKLCRLLGSLTGKEVSGFTFRILNLPDVGRADSENQTAYFSLQTTKTWEQALITVQAVYGEFTNYGYCYALADHLAETLDWKRDNTKDANLYFVDQSPELLHLVYPCFTEKYANENEILACKALSLQLFARLERPYAGAEAFETEISRYAKAMNLSYTPTHLHFAYNGRYCPLKIQTNYFTYLISIDYTGDPYYAESDPVGLWTNEIKALVSEFEFADTSIQSLCNTFGYAPEKTTQVTLFSVDLWGSIPEATGIHSTSLGHMTYYYVYEIYRSISERPAYSKYYCATLAYYYMMKSDYNLSLHVYGEQFKREFQTEARMPCTLENYLKFNCSAMDRYIYENLDKYNPSYWIGRSQTTAECISLAGYLVQTYGEETFIKIMLNPNRSYPLTGKVIKDIEAAWGNYIYSNQNEIL